MRFQEKGKGVEIVLPLVCRSDDVALCCQPEGDLRAMMGCFVQVCKRRDMKINGCKSKVVVLNGGEGLECMVSVDGVKLDKASEFKYLGCIF